MTNLNHLKEQLRRHVERYDSAQDNNVRRMASRKLLELLKENYQVLQEVVPDFQKFCQEFHFCCFHKSVIYKFMSKTIPSFVSNDMSEFISDCMDEQISEVMSEALTESMAEAMSNFWTNVTSKLIHHFWDEFDNATK